MTFKQKVWTLPLLAVLVFAAGFAVALANARQTGAIIEQLGRVEYQYYIRLQTVSTEYTALQEALKGAVAAGDAEVLKALDGRAKAVRAELDGIAALAGKAETAQTLGGAFDAWFVPAQRAAAMMLGADGDPGPVIAAMQSAQTALGAALDSARSAAARGNEAGLESAQTSLDRGLLLNAATALATIVALVAMSAFVIRSIERALGGAPEYATAVLQRIAQGDLASEVRYPERDTGSLLHAAGRLRATLASIVGDTLRSAEAVASAAGELAAGNGDLSQRTENQAAELTVTAGRVGELADRTRENATSARAPARLAAAASDTAARGGVADDEIVRTMSAISDSGRRVTEIIGLIDGIAFQTNILALNAAVEAARAGESGRGFAVVASEVRSLAQRSAEAARQIATLIGDSVGRVDSGSQQVAAAGALMQEIVRGIRSVTEQVERISAASAEQESGIASVNSAIGGLEDATQQNASLVEQASAATLSLRTQADELGRMIAAFRTAAPA
ncbi:MAG: methyl-accepting chemotaxis protein [Burkholderiales bacterium]